LDRIFACIAVGSFFYAEKIEEEIIEKIECLADFPELGKKYKDIPEKKFMKSVSGDIEFFMRSLRKRLLFSLCIILPKIYNSSTGHK